MKKLIVFLLVCALIAGAWYLWKHPDVTGAIGERIASIISPENTEPTGDDPPTDPHFPPPLNPVEPTAPPEASVWKLTFHYEGGSGTHPASYRAEDLPLALDEPTRDGYLFVGWTCDRFAENTPQKFPMIPAGTEGDITLTAVWEWEGYPITYNLDGGKTDNPASYAQKDLPLTLTAPVRPGYTFLGWSSPLLDDGLYKDICIREGSTGAISLTAHWEIVSYALTLQPNGGVLSETPDSSYTVLDSVTLPTPMRTGYLFLGWTGDTLASPSLSVTIPAGSVGDRSYSALWEPLPGNMTCFSKCGSQTLPITPTCLKAADGTYSVTAPLRVGEYRFDRWELNGKTVGSTGGKQPYLHFTLAGDMEWCAVYFSDDPPKVFDKASPKDITLVVAGATRVVGGGISSSDYRCETNRVLLSKDYLMTLPKDLYAFCVEGAKESVFWVRIEDSRTPANLSVTFDTADFPAAELTFSCVCGGKHVLLVDGEERGSCTDGVTFSLDKSHSHTVTVRCESTSGGSASVITPAYTDDTRTFFEETFTWGGKTYDYVVTDEDEYLAFLSYVALVRGVEDFLAAGADPSVDLPDVSFLVLSESLCNRLRDHTPTSDGKDVSAHVTADLMSRISTPMAPGYTLSSSNKEGIYSIRMSYPWGVNANKSGFACKPSIGDPQHMIPASDRSGSFSSFEIDNASLSMPVRNLYELEQMPFGYKPLFSDDPLSQNARNVYLKAKEILRTAVSSGMNDYEKVIAIYSWLAQNVTYDETAATTDGSFRAFTVEGALIDRLAVCDGFASAMKLLCAIEGIECEEYTGLRTPGDASTGHAWNKVRIGGVWLALDVTDGARFKNGYVDPNHLFMDEFQFRRAGHYENDGVIGGYTANAAGIGLSWYALTVPANKPTLDRIVETYDEFCAVVEDARIRGITAVSLLCKDSAAMTSWLNKYPRGTSCYAYDDIYYIVIL